MQAPRERATVWDGTGSWAGGHWLCTRAEGQVVAAFSDGPTSAGGCTVQALPLQWRQARKKQSSGLAHLPRVSHSD